LGHLAQGKREPLFQLNLNLLGPTIFPSNISTLTVIADPSRWTFADIFKFSIEADATVDAR
jgi:hypothetical protein